MEGLTFENCFAFGLLTGLTIAAVIVVYFYIGVEKPWMHLRRK